MRLPLLILAVLMVGCAPAPAPAPQPKAAVDPVTEAWYGVATTELAAANREAEGLLREGKDDQAAAGKSVGVHGADTIRQLLNAGLLDEIHVDLAALLLGSGVRLFDHVAIAPAVLGNPTLIAGVGVTHLRYPVRKL